MKVLKNLFKNIEQKSKLDLIVELLILGNSTEEAIQLFAKASDKFKKEMADREEHHSRSIELIKSVVYSDIEVRYELVMPKEDEI